jgi:hypothetical protein
MQNAIHSDQVGYGRSPQLWKNFPDEDILVRKDRNVGYGFYDDFENFDPTTLTGGYVMLATSGTIAQIADTGNTATTGLGIVHATTNGSAYDELIMARGCGLSAPYKLADNDLCFEARFTVSAITAAKYSMFVGLSEIAAATTNHLYADAGTIADYNMVGFDHLVAEGAAWDGGYKADGQTAQDGATKTKLNALHTMVAATYVKVGFRYCASPKSLTFYVNGAVAQGTSAPAVLSESEIDAVTFPDDVFLTPVIGMVDVAGDAVVGWDLDWWACAQTE